MLAVGAFAALLPLFASADTLSELQARIDTLLNQVAALQEQLARVQSSTPTPQACTQEAKQCPDGSFVSRTGPNCAFAPCGPFAGPPDPVPPGRNRVCLPILRQLTRGVSGDDVWSVQDFLRQEGVFTLEPTGYFGSVTEYALQLWQAREGIVSSGNPSSTGWGAVGPRTRLIIKNKCAPQDGLQASPRTGVAPLTVTFTAKVPNSGGTGSTYTMDYGDGVQEVVQPLPGCDANNPLAGKCEDKRTIQHTYTANGSYKATLTHNTPGGCTPEAAAQGCLGPPASSQVIGVATLIVGPITATEAPVIASISAPSTLRVGQTGTWHVNTRIISGDTTFSVIWGDESVLQQIQAYASSTVQNHATFTHAYANAGTYTPRFTATNPKGSTSAGYPVVIGGVGGGGGGGGGGNISFSAFPTSGAAPLTVAFLVQSISLNGPYSINFGDGTSANVQKTPCTSTCPNVDMINTSHTYTTSGTYTATLTDPGGCTPAAAAQGCLGPPATLLGSVTITVGTNSGNVCTRDAFQCPDGSFVGRTGLSCTFVCQSATSAGSCVWLGKTYANGERIDMTAGDISSTLRLFCRNGQVTL
ncbi:hypothetical protein A3C18_02070 [Candidatus Kaiserbacteria bacterium RIFCSPHIGHO2_02_FULL_54_11b]|uniref:PKD domain-containing protein n=2 Tax=Candidatus Kaiseribacteriota TaxID=1752734 RepID=A0A1F6CSU9_9BACT|nr:MAG: hypothetical protein A2704_00330 [Candidatus Kaiserbacteria bacterium RIFCSPHIGHO2_01_FULL_54_36b]OGG63912.1 MAG: hypothetical protein A3C18_02070 [Candidatus Kaiserbacteria bacterium RIFCSPHIGHO2_02_FULL_54_11b]